jgi:membrane associated rhomboid family serine protease
MGRRCPPLPICSWCASSADRRSARTSRSVLTAVIGCAVAPPICRAGRTRLGRTDSRPYATILLVAVSCVVWVVLHAKPTLYLDMTILGPLRGDWWKLLTSQFAYVDGLYEFVTLVGIALFGWLLERRYGPAVVLALALGAGVAGALVASAVYAEPIVSGGNAAALGLLAAWAVPDLRDVRAGNYYEGDLLGVAAIAALLLAMPYARPEASWLAGVTGGVFGLVLGLGMYRLDPPER